MRRWLVAAAGVLALGTFVPTAYADPVELQGPSIAPVGSNVVVSVMFANPGSSLWFSSFKIESSAPLVSVTTTSNVRCFNFITFINCTATLASAGETGSATVVVGPIPAGATTVTAGGTSTSGPYTLTKVINGLVPGVPTELAFTTQPSNATAGVAVSPAVQVSVRDAFGDVVTDASGSITIGLGSNPGGSILSGTKTVAPVNGVATFWDLSLDKAGSGYTLAADAIGLPAVTSSAFAVAPAAASRLAFSIQPSNVQAGSSMAPAVVVAVQDAFGNIVGTATSEVTLALASNPGGATLSGTSTAAAVAGAATFSNISLDKAGSGYTVTASAAGLTSATSDPFNVTPGPPAQLSFAVQPSDSGAGSAIAPAVQVALLDAFGNLTTATDNVTVALAANPGGSTLGGTATVAAVGGVATFTDLSLNKIGAGYTLAAGASGLTAITSNTFAISPGPASQLVFLVQPSDTIVDAPITPPVQVGLQDAYGNPTTVAGTVTLTLATNPGGAALAGATAAAVNGVATFPNLALDRAGAAYTLSAGAPALTGATSSPFDVAGPPPGGKIAVRPRALSFGGVHTGSIRSRRLTIANAGAVTVGVGYTLAGADAEAFTITLPTSSIAAGGSATCTVAFAPDHVGSATAVLVLTGNFGRVEVRLRGRGLASRVH